MKEINLSDYRINHWSQCGEDGVVEKLLEIMGIKSGWLVEFGAWDGIWHSNTHYHWQNNKNFQLCLIEEDERKARCGQGWLMAEKGNNLFLNQRVELSGANSLSRILERHEIFDIAVMSIDVDGGDLDIWNTLDKEKFAPKIVIIEEGRWKEAGRIDYLVECFYGYRLVAVTGNFIFVRMGHGIKQEATPQELMRSSGHPELSLHFGDITQEEADYYFDLMSMGDKTLYKKLAGPQIVNYPLPKREGAS